MAISELGDTAVLVLAPPFHRLNLQQRQGPTELSESGESRVKKATTARPKCDIRWFHQAATASILKRFWRAKVVPTSNTPTAELRMTLWMLMCPTSHPAIAMPVDWPMK